MVSAVLIRYADAAMTVLHRKNTDLVLRNGDEISKDIHRSFYEEGTHGVGQEARLPAVASTWLIGAFISVLITGCGRGLAGRPPLVPGNF